MPRGDNQYINRYDPKIQRQAKKLREDAEFLRQSAARVAQYKARRGRVGVMWDKIDKTVLGAGVGAIAGATGSLLGDKLSSTLAKRAGFGMVDSRVQAVVSRVPGGRFLYGPQGVVVGAVLGAVVGAYQGHKQDVAEDMDRALRIKAWQLRRDTEALRRAKALAAHPGPAREGRGVRKMHSDMERWKRGEPERLRSALHPPSVHSRTMKPVK